MPPCPHTAGDRPRYDHSDNGDNGDNGDDDNDYLGAEGAVAAQQVPLLPTPVTELLPDLGLLAREHRDRGRGHWH